MSSLVDIISDDLMMPDNHPGYISEAILKYESTFREATLTNFEDDRYGILKLASIFKQEFDPLNDDSSCHAVIRAFDRSAGLLDFLHLDYFLKSDRYLSSVNLRDRNRDAVSHAIVSFGLEWNADSWKSFVERFPNHQRFAKHICEERERTDVFIFGSSVGRVTYVKTTFRVLRNYFVEVNRDEASRPEPSRFELVQLLNWGFVQHLRDVHHMIRWGEGVKNIKMLENPMAIPYDITNSVGAYGQLRNESSAKFITGQACCGKTTLLTRLRQLGWKVLSRGDIGSFSGKAHNAAAVACLHASFEWVLSHSDVLGVRCLFLYRTYHLFRIPRFFFLLSTRIAPTSTTRYGSGSCSWWRPSISAIWCPIYWISSMLRSTSRLSPITSDNAASCS